MNEPEDRPAAGFGDALRCLFRPRSIDLGRRNDHAARPVVVFNTPGLRPPIGGLKITDRRPDRRHCGLAAARHLRPTELDLLAHTVATLRPRSPGRFDTCADGLFILIKGGSIRPRPRAAKSHTIVLHFTREVRSDLPKPRERK